MSRLARFFASVSWSKVDTVFIAGKAVKQGGRLAGVDLARMRREAEQSRDYIAGKAGWSKERLLRTQ